MTVGGSRRGLFVKEERVPQAGPPSGEKSG